MTVVARTRWSHGPRCPGQEPLAPGTRTAAVADRSQRFLQVAAGAQGRQDPGQRAGARRRAQCG